MKDEITIPADLMPRQCAYLMAKLRRTEDRLHPPHEPEGTAWLAIVCLCAYAIQLSRQALIVRHAPLACWLLLRTLWHNAGHLSWLLHGPGETQKRIDKFIDDHDIRAELSLVKETYRILGGTKAEAALGVEKDPYALTILKKLAQHARERRESASGNRSDWARISVKELEKSIRAAFNAATTIPELGEDANGLNVWHEYAKHAVVQGDDIAHPNPFTILTAKNLFDCDNLRILRPDEVAEDKRDEALRMLTLLSLLAVHAVAIAAYDHSAVDIPHTLAVFSRQVLRSRFRPGNSKRKLDED